MNLTRTEVRPRGNKVVISYGVPNWYGTRYEFHDKNGLVFSVHTSDPKGHEVIRSAASIWSDYSVAKTKAYIRNHLPGKYFPSELTGE